MFDLLKRLIHIGKATTVNELADYCTDIKPFSADLALNKLWKLCITNHFLESIYEHIGTDEFKENVNGADVVVYSYKIRLNDYTYFFKFSIEHSDLYDMMQLKKQYGRISNSSKNNIIIKEITFEIRDINNLLIVDELPLCDKLTINCSGGRLYTEIEFYSSYFNSLKETERATAIAKLIQKNRSYQEFPDDIRVIISKVIIFIFSSANIFINSKEYCFYNSKGVPLEYDTVVKLERELLTEPAMLSYLEQSLDVKEFNKIVNRLKLEGYSV